MKTSVEDETVKKLLSVFGICNGGPKDLADNHDKYLYRMERKCGRYFEEANNE